MLYMTAWLNTARRKIAGKLLTHKEIDQKKYFMSLSKIENNIQYYVLCSVFNS